MKRYLVHPKVGFRILVVKLTILPKFNNMMANMPCGFPYFNIHLKPCLQDAPPRPYEEVPGPPKSLIPYFGRQIDNLAKIQ